MSESTQPTAVADDKTKSVLSFFHHKLSHDNPRVVRFFDRKEFYTVVGENALFVAREFYKTTTVVKQLAVGDVSLPVVNVNRSLFETIVRELIVDGTEHEVEVYEDKSGWKLGRTASPGKLGSFEEELFRGSDLADTPVVMAAKLVMRDSQCVVSLAYLNTATREIGAAEFVDDDQFCAFDAACVQIGARECVLPKDDASPERRRLLDVLGRAGALATERKASEFSGKDVQHDLTRLLKGNVEHYRAVLEREGAAGCIAALLSFTELMADLSHHGKFTLVLHDTGKYMRMDAAALRALNVLRQRQDPNDTFSLYGLMNKSRTPMGKRLLLRWLKQPLLDVAAINERHDVVEAMVDDVDLRERLRSVQLRALPDMERLARKLERKKTTLQDLCRLYQASAQLPHLADALAEHASGAAPLLQRLYVTPLRTAHDAEHLGKFESLLESAVDLDRIPDDYLIAATFDPELKTLQATKDQIQVELEKVWDDAARSLGLEKDKVLKLERSHLGHYFRLSKKEETAVRKKLQASFSVLEARKDGTKFTNAPLKRLSERRAEADQAYEQQQRQLVERVVEVASSFAEVFLEVSAVLAHLDVLTGFAELSANAPAPFVRPVMRPKEDGTVSLQRCRHPCVEAQDSVTFIPNDCELQKGAGRFHIITGPNMGGKSTYIRQVGVCVLMAQAGCFVPCDGATIAVRDAIFARVGAGDCQLRGVSTFMAEMLETASILKGATAASLVIIDELGRGTSTYDGFGLAWAISEHLLDHIGCPTLFATHFHELTALQTRAAGGVVNRHVTAHIDAASRKLTMLYELKDGACDQSFGIHCAEFARFPPQVLELARSKAAELEDFTAPEAAEGGAAVGVGGKRKRVAADDATEGAARARRFLADFATLPLPQLSPTDAAEQVQELCKGLEADAAGNPWLKQLLTRA